MIDSACRSGLRPVGGIGGGYLEAGVGISCWGRVIRWKPGGIGGEMRWLSGTGMSEE